MDGGRLAGEGGRIGVASNRREARYWLLKELAILQLEIKIIINGGIILISN